MSPTASFEPGLLFLAQLLVGLAVGLVYFNALRRAVTRLTERKGWFESVVLTAGRVSIAVAAFAIAARVSAAALLMTFLGFLIARIVTVYLSRRAL